MPLKGGDDFEEIGQKKAKPQSRENSYQMLGQKSLAYDPELALLHRKIEMTHPPLLLTVSHQKFWQRKSHQFGLQIANHY